MAVKALELLASALGTSACVVVDERAPVGETNELRDAPLGPRAQAQRRVLGYLAVHEDRV